MNSSRRTSKAAAGKAATDKAAAGKAATGKATVGKDATEFTPLANAKKAILQFGYAHPRLVVAGAAVAVVAMGMFIAWFVCLSGFSTTTALIYAGF